MRKRIVAIVLSLVVGFQLPVNVSANSVSDNTAGIINGVEENNVESLSSNNFMNGYISDGISHGFPANGLNEYSVNELGNEDIDAETASTYPIKYDPRTVNGVSGIRTQALNTCWLYSAVAATESNLIKKGYTNSTIDLSELQVAYFMYHKNIDPLGNYSNDVEDTSDSVTTILGYGGTHTAAVSFLSKWTGPVLESQVPMHGEEMPLGGYVFDWDKIDATNLGQELCANSSNWHFKGAKYCDYDMSHLDNVKELISAYGGVCAAYYSSSDDAYYGFFNEGDDVSYYFPPKAGSNHSIELVGWDDTYSASNFRKRPAGDGAWLMKNSWGTTFSDNNGTHGSGYFWLSYYDPNICDIIAVEFDNKDAYSNLYAYDGNHTNAGGTGVKDAYTSVNVYRAAAYGGKEVEKIDGVMTYLDADTTYGVTIYLNPVIEDGKLVGYSGKSGTVTGKSDYDGFYTIDTQS